jgi:8-oxo-dGTP pyrophosphatase MutT (NUDIX family)
MPRLEVKRANGHRLRVRGLIEQTSRQQYAALPYRISEVGIEVLLVTTLDTRRWIIPKGWPMKGRTPAVSAAREAFEEAGVRGAIAPAPVGSFTYDKIDRRGVSRRIEVEVFPLRVLREHRNWPERKKRATKWMMIDEAAASVEEVSLRALLKSFSTHRMLTPLHADLSSSSGRT